MIEAQRNLWHVAEQRFAREARLPETKRCSATPLSARATRSQRSTANIELATQELQPLGAADVAFGHAADLERWPVTERRTNVSGDGQLPESRLAVGSANWYVRRVR